MAFMSLPLEIHMHILSFLLPPLTIADSPYTRGRIDARNLTQLCLVHPTWREISQKHLFQQIRLNAVELPELVTILEASKNKMLASAIRLAYIVFHADHDIERPNHDRNGQSRVFSRLTFEEDVPLRWPRFDSLWHHLSKLHDIQKLLLHLDIGPQKIIVGTVDISLHPFNVPPLIVLQPNEWKLPILANVAEVAILQNMTGGSDYNIAFAPTALTELLLAVGPCARLRFPRQDERSCSRRFRKEIFTKLCETIPNLQKSVVHLDVSFWPRRIPNSHRKHARVYSHVQAGDVDILSQAIQQLSGQLVTCKLSDIRLSPQFFTSSSRGEESVDRADLAGATYWPELKTLDIKIGERDAFGVWWCDGDFNDEVNDPEDAVLDPDGHDEFVPDQGFEVVRNIPKDEKFDQLSVAASHTMAKCMPKVRSFHLSYIDYHIYDLHFYRDESTRCGALKYFASTEENCYSPSEEVLAIWTERWGDELNLEPMEKEYSSSNT